MSNPLLPEGQALERSLRLPSRIPLPLIRGRLERGLHGPLSEFLDRPGKALRGQLVEVGYLLGTASERDDRVLEGLSACIEAIHAGSLIVDDIEDNSHVRRGTPTLHRKHGLAIALNSGNWLYFRALSRFLELELAPAVERRCLELLSDNLLRAHYGQALDVGVPADTVPQDEVYDLCMSAMSLKSGALTALALTLGATVSGADSARIDALGEFGERLGTALQMFDDIRNLERPDPADPTNAKRLEDLHRLRPSWIWAAAAKLCAPRDYQDFVRAARMLPDESYLTAWLGIHDFIEQARRWALEYLAESFSALEAQLAGHSGGAEALERLRAIAAVIEGKS